MLDRMYKEYPKGTAPAALEALAEKIRTADAFVFVTGEYNWGVQPGLKNLTDHFLEEWFWRPAAIASYSAGRFSGVRSALVWHGILSEMGMVVISSTLAVGPIAQTLDADGQPTGDGGAALAPRLPPLRRRPRLVDRGGAGAAGAQGAAVLTPRRLVAPARVSAQAGAMITVHHLNNSRSQRVLWLLEELGAPVRGETLPARRGDHAGAARRCARCIRSASRR